MATFNNCRQPPDAHTGPALPHHQAAAPRIVIDTSAVLTPVLYRNSRHRWLRNAWHAGQITPLVSDYTVNEFQRVLRKPNLSVAAHQISAHTADYLNFCLTVAVPDPPPETPHCRDPKDRPFLQLAYYANADYLVARDRDLLVLKDESAVPIIDPDALLEILKIDFR